MRSEPCPSSAPREAIADLDTGAPRLTYSLVVLTYNQETYVREAVRAALAQRYEPLEIIISDDGSSDGSYDAIREETEGYAGPHKLTIRRNDENIGLVAHLNLISDLASGDVIIPAYGDDISLPDRVSEIAKVFEAQTPLLVHSDAVAIDEHGAKTQSRYRKADFYRTTDPLETATSMSLYLGAAGAWHRDLFQTYGPLRYPEVYDDHILGFRAALEGRIVFLEKPLLKYREGVGISHRFSQDRDQTQHATRRRKILAMMAATYRQRLADAKTYGLGEDHPICRKLSHALAKVELRDACYDGIASMLAKNLNRPVLALSAAAAEGMRILRRR